MVISRGCEGKSFGRLGEVRHPPRPSQINIRPSGSSKDDLQRRVFHAFHEWNEEVLSIMSIRWSRLNPMPGTESLKNVVIGLTGGLVLAVMTFGVLAGTAVAQSVDIPAIMDPDIKGPPTALSVAYGHQFSADVEDPGTEMSRDNVFFSGAHRFKLDEKTSLFAIGTYTLHNYNFSKNNGPLSRYQWDDVHRVVIGALVGYDVDERWRIIGGLVGRSWGEGGADFGDSLTAGALFGFDYHPNENFSVGLILGAFSALEDSVGLLPVPTMKWKFAEDWRWNIGMVNVLGDPGVGTEINWQVAETVSLGAGVAFQSRRYRLDDSTARSGIPQVGTGRTDEGGVGQETGTPLFVAARWRPTAKSSLDVLTGVTFGGKVRLESKAGGYIAEDSFDPAPFIGLRGTIVF